MFTPEGSDNYSTRVEGEGEGEGGGGGGGVKEGVNRGGEDARLIALLLARARDLTGDAELNSRNQYCISAGDFQPIVLLAFHSQTVQEVHSPDRLKRNV